MNINKRKKFSKIRDIDWFGIEIYRIRQQYNFLNESFAKIKETLT